MKWWFQSGPVLYSVDYVAVGFVYVSASCNSRPQNSDDSIFCIIISCMNLISYESHLGSVA